MVADDEQLLRLQNKLKTQENYEAEEEQRNSVDNCMQGSTDSLLKVPNRHHAIRKEGFKRRTGQFAWRQRSIIVCFYLHPRLGNKKRNYASNMFNVPWKTIENWLWLNKMRRKWIAFALSLTIEDIISSLPEDYREHCMHVHKEYAGTPYALSMKALKLEQHLGEEQLVAHQAGGSKSH